MRIRMKVMFGLMELFRSMTRAEYFDILENGWRMGGDSKFCVVGFEIDNDIAKKACIADYDLDGIGKSRAIEIDDLNKKTYQSYKC